MMDHKTFLKTLTVEDRARLTAVSDAPALWRLGVYGGLLVALGAAIAAGIPGWPALMVAQGILLAFLFNLSHECTHKTPFRTARLNEAVGHVTGLLIVQPFLWFRYFHLAHHRHTNDPERDPELAGAGKPRTWGDYLIHVSAVTYWRDKVRLLADHARGRVVGDYIPLSARGGMVREARVFVAVYGAVLAVSVFISPVLLWAWLIPLALGFPFLRLYHLAEHGRCAHVADMFANTRTVFTSPFARFVTWNMPYHVEHHVFPQVPFHRLPALHDLTQAHLKETSPGYVAFSREYAGHLKAIVAH